MVVTRTCENDLVEGFVFVLTCCYYVLSILTTVLWMCCSLVQQYTLVLEWLILVMSVPQVITATQQFGFLDGGVGIRISKCIECYASSVCMNFLRTIQCYKCGSIDD